MVAVQELIQEDAFSAKARERLRRPLRRGVFRDIDAAKAQLGLLTVGDDKGQARIYWLIDLATDVVEDARFLAFGSMASHPITDCWCDLVRGKPFAEASTMDVAAIEAALRDDAGTPAFGDDADDSFAFVHDLQAKARAAREGVALLPEPVEIVRYERKREADWDEHDRRWLPLSLMDKIVKVQEVAGRSVLERLGRDDLDWQIDGLHDDFQVVLAFNTGKAESVQDEQRATVQRFIEEALRAEIHPQLHIEERDDG